MRHLIRKLRRLIGWYVESRIEFEDCILNVLLARVVPGTEHEVAMQLTNSSNGSYIFKVIGEYDLAKLEVAGHCMFSQQDMLSQKDYLSQNILDYAAFPCFAFKPESSDYSCHHLTSSIISSNPILALTLIYLQPNVTEHYRLKFLLNFSKEIYQYHEGDLQFSSLNSIGQNAITLLIGCDSFESIFSCVSFIRQCYSESIIATNTIPLISYQHVIQPNSYTKLKGNIRAQIAIQCTLGAEEVVLKQFPLEKYDYRGILGTFDLMLLTKGAVPASEFFENLVNSRNESRASGTFYVTSTIISSPSHASIESIPQPAKVLKEYSYSTSIKRRRFNNIQTALQLLDSISSFPGVDYYVIQQTRGLLRRFSACSIDPALASVISDFDIPIE